MANATAIKIQADPMYPHDRTPNAGDFALHGDARMYVYSALLFLSEDWPQPHVVEVNTNVYAQEGEVHPAFEHDGMVAFDVNLGANASYRFWLTGKPPDFVMEIVTTNSLIRDTEHKFKLYAQLGIPEYWQYDPYGDCLPQPLQGWRLWQGGYAAIPGEERKADVRYYSDALQTWLGLVSVSRPMKPSKQGEPAMRFRFWAPSLDDWYPTHLEMIDYHLQRRKKLYSNETALAQARAQLHQARARRDQLAAELEEAEREVERLRDVL